MSAVEAERSLVLVAGSGRSGTSLFSGILQRLGFHVPQPEVPADDTNPRGFGESQWVVDFHTKLLKRARVQLADARPQAWTHTAELSMQDGVQDELREWLREEYRQHGHLIVKDPRLSWFLPLWRRCAQDLGVTPRFVTMLRHPAAVIDSKQKWYGGWQGDVSRTAGWVHQTLFTERATRDSPRIFVRYEDLLEDWTQVVGRVGETLELAVIRDAPASRMRDVHDFVDRSLSRSQPDWGDRRIPPSLRAQADEVWELVSQLADPDPADVSQRLDELRAAYVEYYAEAEAIAQSSIAAGRKSPPPPPPAVQKVPTPAVRLARKVPKRYRHKVPVQWRVGIARAIGRGTRR